MSVLDAYAVIAYLRGETCADEVIELLRDPTVLTAVNAAEVVDQLVRVFGQDADDVHADLALLASNGMTLRSVSAELGLEAGRLRARHYHRVRRAVSLADCVAAGAALAERRPLATSDPALAALVREEGGEVHALPAGDGTRP